MTESHQYAVLPTHEYAGKAAAPMISSAIEYAAALTPPLPPGPPAGNVHNPAGSRGKKKKKRGKLCLCCSSVDFETEEDKEKVFSFLESTKDKFSLKMCCSSFQVGSRKNCNNGDGVSDPAARRFKA